MGALKNLRSVFGDGLISRHQGGPAAVTHEVDFSHICFVSEEFHCGLYGPHFIRQRKEHTLFGHYIGAQYAIPAFRHFRAGGAGEVILVGVHHQHGGHGFVRQPIRLVQHPRHPPSQAHEGFQNGIRFFGSPLFHYPTSAASLIIL